MVAGKRCLVAVRWRLGENKRKSASNRVPYINLTFNKLGWLRGLATSVVCTLTMRSFRRVPDRPLRLNRPRMSAPRGRADIPSLSADFSE